jgi:type II secretory pathway pseudopilin PulG
MDTVLLVITLISAATAVVALASGRRVRRIERERSEARVAALAHAADTHGTTDGGWTSVAGEWQWNPEPASQGIRDSGFGISAARASREERVIPVTERIPNPQSQITDSAGQISSGGMFGTVERQEPSGSKLPIFAAAILIVMLGGALIFLNTSASGDRGATVSQVNQTEPLELVALGHARETRVLTITGTVRNPASGAKVEGLTAVISLLDRGGTLVSTKDVPLDYRALGPGEEAPFKVSIPDPGSIARYRVSFRAGTDVVPHVDRRTDTKLASARQ